MAEVDAPGDDWRLTNQASYLTGAVLTHRTWAGDDHDHCEFCFAKFSERDGDLLEGWTTSDEYRWICPTCFEDFGERFGWRVED